MYSPAEEYYAWLLDKIDDGNRKIMIFQKALDILFHTPFEYRYHGDGNRLNDGLRLRERYCEEFRVRYENLERSLDICSVLEVMVALADRIEFQDMHDPDLGDRTHLWFWHMFESLGLGMQSDDFFNEPAVKDILEKFNKRRYARNGSGSLFSIADPRIDMRREELWYQAQYWLSENYI